MSTLHTTRRGALRRWGATALTLATALIAIGVAVVFITLGGNQRNDATPRHAASNVVPGLRHDRAAVAETVRGAVPSTGGCTYERAEHSCVSGP